MSANLCPRTLPPPGAAHVWVADTDSIPATAALGHLDPDELQRARRFHRPADAHRFGAGRLLLRTALRAYLPRTAKGLHFVLDKAGKPHLSGPCHQIPIHFSLAHVDRILVVAVASSRVGVDVERMRAFPDLDAVAGVCFTAEERALLGSRCATERFDLFFTIWTRKEALAKALGAGLGAALPSTTPDFPSGWSGGLLTSPEGYRSAIVIEGELAEVQYVTAGPEETAWPVAGVVCSGGGPAWPQ
jgi:4'-phosphopantetheinyl transferase